MKSFSDFHKDAVMDGRKVSINDIVDKQLVILAFAERNSRYARNDDGKYLILQVEMDGERLVVFTAASVLRDQLSSYREHLPFSAKIVYNGKYYSFK